VVFFLIEKFELNTKTPKSFIVDVDTDVGKQPSFGNSPFSLPKKYVILIK